MQLPGDSIVYTDKPGFIRETCPWEWNGRFQPWSWTFVLIQPCFVWEFCLFSNNTTQRTLRKSPGCDRQTHLIVSFNLISRGKKVREKKGTKRKRSPLEPLSCPSHQPRGSAQLNLNCSFQGFGGALPAPGGHWALRGTLLCTCPQVSLSGHHLARTDCC